MRGKPFFEKVISLLVLLPVILITSCTTDYVTGKRTFSLVSESQEVAMGREADPQIVSEYGLYEDPELAAFIDNLGQSLARTSQRPQLKYTFRVLDSPVVNAFALPGGYVYVTRGILAHFNSEDELAGVMGHEIGHVVARHSAEQISRVQLASIGLGLGSLISEEFQKFAGAAEAGLGLMFLSFSRKQESESDMLGVEYSTRLGYDANKMAGFFRILKSMGARSGQSLPSFLATHPDPGDRESRVHQLTDEWQQIVAYRPLGREPYSYLRRIDGLVYGRDPRQGYEENQVFFHPALRFKFPVPDGWQVINSPSTVQILSPKKAAAIQLTLGKSRSLQQEADNFIAKNGVSVKRRESARVHGFKAVIMESGVRDGEKNLSILSYFILKGGNVYVFHGFTRADLFGGYIGVFTRVMDGFEEVRDRHVLDKKPKHLRLEKAPKTGSIKKVLLAMGVDENMLGELALLNGRAQGDVMQKGEWIKIIR